MKEVLKQRNKNPLYQKYMNEGDHAFTYICPERRKEIYNHMRLKVNIHN